MQWMSALCNLLAPVYIYLIHGIFLLCCRGNLSRASYQCMKVMDKEPLIQTKQALKFFLNNLSRKCVFDVVWWVWRYASKLLKCKLIKIPWRSNYRKHFIRCTPLLVLVIFCTDQSETRKDSWIQEYTVGILVFAMIMILCSEALRILLIEVMCWWK